MKTLRYGFILFCITLNYYCFSQTSNNQENNGNFNSSSNEFEIKPNFAHPDAKKLLNEEFYWSTVDETAPFGNNDGYDIFFEFIDWRKANKEESVLLFLYQQIENKNFPVFDLKENDSLLIKRYISGSTLNEKLLDQVKENSKRIAQDKENTTANQTLNQSSSSNAKTMGLWHLLSIDNIIIATSYAQFILEGKAEEEIKELAKVAIRRELLSMLLDKWDINYRKIRKEYLLKMLENIEKIPD